MNQSTAETRSSPRMRRLWADYMALSELVKLSDLIEIAPGGDPADRYRVLYRCRSLVIVAGQDEPEVSEQHICDIYLHRDYPQRPPYLIWRTSIFHPNIMPPERGGAVCIGAWSPGESLPNLVLRVGEMIQYRNFDLDDVLNEEAVKWARYHQDRLPIDDRPLAPGY